MTCYIRHLTDILKDIDREDTRENRKELDRRIRIFLNRENDDCPVVWNDIKSQIHDPVKRDLLIENLKKNEDPQEKV